MNYLPFHVLKGAMENDPSAMDQLVKYLDVNIISPRCTMVYSDEYGHTHSDLDEDLRSLGFDVLLNVLRAFRLKDPPDDFV